MAKEFRKLDRRPRVEDGYRLASVEEVKKNFQWIKNENILDSWDIVRLLDGWVTGPGYRYELEVGYKPNMGHMMVVETDVSGKMQRDAAIQQLYSGLELKDEGRKAALLLSCDDKNSEVIYWLLSTIDQAELDRLTKSVNQTFREGKTVLHYAIESGKENDALGVAKLLLEKFEFGKELVRRCDKYGRSVLHLASLHGHACLCKLLVDKFQLKGDETDRYGQTALHFAAKSKVQDIDSVLRALLKGSSEQGIDGLVKSRDEKGKTPLHIAAARGNTEMVTSLLLYISEGREEYVRKPDLFGQTALHEAASGGHTTTMKELLENGSEPLAERDGDGKTALHYAVQLDNSQKPIDGAKLLLTYCKSEEEKYLLMWASAAGVGTAEESARSSKGKKVQDHHKLKTFFLKKRKKSRRS